MAQASAEKLKQNRLAEKRRVASRPQRGSWHGHQSRLCQKNKEQSRQFKSPDCEVGKSQGE